MSTVRRAQPRDAEALAALRALTHEEMGNDPGDAAHRRHVVATFRRRLAEDPSFAAFVVEQDGEVVACAAGWVEQHLPSPSSPDGRRGHVANVSTARHARRQGHARAVLEALMAWTAEQGLRRVDLRATDDGRGLYEALGFRALGGTTMAWTAPGVLPGMPAR